ncbi:MAG: hypothetical protein JXA54_01930 [Candidatus Heimdallarchaeota archaeon]|nr:hypothetical protein [Candidatus Heimdallarchaeota archaeon]
MSHSQPEIITEEMVNIVKSLIADNDEVNVQWLKTVTQMNITTISRIIIQNLGMIVLEGIIYTKEKAERKLKQKQEEAKAQVDRESFRKGPVKIDTMVLREKLWTVNLPERMHGLERHQFCPIWAFLEQDFSTAIILRYDWLSRFETAIKSQMFSKTRIIKAKDILNEYGENLQGKAKAIFAKTYPRDSMLDKNQPLWVLFMISLNEGGVKLEGLDMINVLSLSTKFRSREKAYSMLNEYIELINFIVNDPSIFEEIIVIE